MFALLLNDIRTTLGSSLRLSPAHIAQAFRITIYSFDAPALRVNIKAKQPINDELTQIIKSLTYLCSMPKIGAMYAQKKLLECL